MSPLGMKKNLRNFLILLFVCLVAYYPVLGRRAVDPDANLILPGLMGIKNPLEYLRMVAGFDTIDFQPVRDLTFFIDLFIFRSTGIVTLATLNVCLWATAGYFLLRILERIVPEERKRGALFWVILFLVWPLFSQAVPWGMARKHILAFTLILAATNFFFDWMEGKRNWITSYLTYVAAGLSHPIVLFWPLWAFLHARIAFPTREKTERRKFFMFIVTMGVLLLTNYAYYTIGNTVVAENFWKMKPDYFNIQAQLMRLGFVFRQITFPVHFGFLYRPELSDAWPGFIVIGFIGLLAWMFRKERQIYSWLFFIVMSFPITLTLENFFDQYMILPATGIFILLFFLFHRPSKKGSVFLAVCSVFVGIYTITQVNIWANHLKFTKRNFEKFPTCSNATNYASRIYDNEGKAPLELLQFIEKNNCILINPVFPAGIFRKYVYLLTRMMYYEDDKFSREDRYTKLRELGRLYYFPQLVYATLLAEDDRAEEVEEACKFILEIVGDNQVETTTLIQKNLRPYCERKQLPACLKLTEYTKPPEQPY